MATLLRISGSKIPQPAKWNKGLVSYCYMPISLGLALSWFIGSLVELTVAGIIVGLLLKPAEVQSH